MKIRYFIGVMLGYKFVVKFVIFGIKNMYKVSIEILVRKIIIFKNIVEFCLRFIYNILFI